MFFVWFSSACECRNGPQCRCEETVRNAEDDDGDVGGKDLKCEKGVTASADYDREKTPRDVAASLVDQQAQDRRGGSRHEVRQGDDIAGLLGGLVRRF